MSTHQEIVSMHKRAIKHREQYWAEAADNLAWNTKWAKVVDDSASPFTKWFLGGELNLCYNCVDRHVDGGRGESRALIFDSPVTDTRSEFTYAQVQDQVRHLAGALRGLGVQKGDVVMVFTSLIPEGVFSLLACARIGALHVGMPSGISPEDLAPKIDHCKPKVMVVASHGYHAEGWKNYKDVVDKAYTIAKHKPNNVIVIQRQHMAAVSVVCERDKDWVTLLSSSLPADCEPLDANQPQIMIYTSGSTGDPKAIVHSVGSFAVRLRHDSPILFGSEQDIAFGTSSIGWIAGHLLIYGPMLIGATSVAFEGDALFTADVRVLYRLVSTNGITRCLIRPGILKAMKAKDPEGLISKEFNFDRLQVIYAGGERTDTQTMQWAAKYFQAPVWDIWGQTEVGSVFTGAPDMTIPKNSGAVAEKGLPLPGWQLVIMKEDGIEAKPNEVGRVLIRLPLPPGGIQTTFGEDHLCLKNYYQSYPGFYDTKDEGFLSEEGLLKVVARVDDIMKVGNIYLPAQTLEELILNHNDVSDCVVISITDLIWKEIPIALYTRRSDCKQGVEETSKQLEGLVSERFGASVKFGGAILVSELPLTRTGKIHRPSCRDMARGRQITGTGSVENPKVFLEIIEALKKRNFGKNVLLD